jgi:hypothetical protein
VIDKGNVDELTNCDYLKKERMCSIYSASDVDSYLALRNPLASSPIKYRSWSVPSVAARRIVSATSADETDAPVNMLRNLEF